MLKYETAICLPDRRIAVFTCSMPWEMLRQNVNSLRKKIANIAKCGGGFSPNQIVINQKHLEVYLLKSSGDKYKKKEEDVTTEAL